MSNRNEREKSKNNKYEKSTQKTLKISGKN